jgi:hypothetical protein
LLSFARVTLSCDCPDSYAAARRAKHARFAAAFAARSHFHRAAGVRAWLAAAADISSERVSKAMAAHEASARRIFACVARCARRWRESARARAERRGFGIGSGGGSGGTGSAGGALLVFSRPAATGAVDALRPITATKPARSQPSVPLSASLAACVPPPSAQNAACLASSAAAADEDASVAVAAERPLSSVRVLEEWEAMRAARDQRRQRGAEQTQQLMRAQMQPKLEPQSPNEHADSKLASSAPPPMPLQASMPSNPPRAAHASLLSSPPLPPLLPTVLQAPPQPLPPSEITLLESRAARLLRRKVQRAELAAHAARLADAEVEAEAAIAAAVAVAQSNTAAFAGCSTNVSSNVRGHADASSVENWNLVNAASTSSASASPSSSSSSPTPHAPALSLLTRLRREVAAQRAAVDERLRALDARHDDEVREARAIGDRAFAIAQRRCAAPALAMAQ